MWRSLDSVIEESDRPDNAGEGICARADIERQLSKRVPLEEAAPAPERLERNERIRWYRAHGWQLREIAEEFHISRQRVHQICKPKKRKEVIP